MKRYLSIGLALGLLVCFLTGLSSAQEEVEAETEYSWGTVISVSSNKIVVAEYDYDTDKEVNVEYDIDPKVELKGAASLKDIVAGDSVEIDYVSVGNKNTAKVIAAEKQYQEETEEEVEGEMLPED